MSNPRGTPMTPHEIRADMDDCAYLWDAKEQYGFLATALKNSSKPPYLPNLIMQAMTAHDEAGKALQRIAERYK